MAQPRHGAIAAGHRSFGGRKDCPDHKIFACFQIRCENKLAKDPRIMIYSPCRVGIGHLLSRDCSSIPCFLLRFKWPVQIRNYFKKGKDVITLSAPLHSYKRYAVR